jgi:hypothetical protein
MPHVQTTDGRYLDLEIENIQNKQEYLSNFIFNHFEKDGITFNELNQDDKERLKYFYYSLSMKKIQNIKIKVTSLLMSRPFMSAVRNNTKQYQDMLHQYNIQRDRRISHKDIAKYLRKKYDLNEYDIEYIKNEYLNSQKPDWNEVFNTQPEQRSESEPEEQRSESEPEEQRSESEPEEQSNEDYDYPLYETHDILVTKLDISDVVYISDELYAVIRWRRNKVQLQHLYSGTMVTLRKKPGKYVRILEDHSVENVVREFIEQNHFDKLPKVVRDDYDFLINKRNN